MPADDSWFARKIEDLQRQINELRSAVPNAITSRNFDGTLTPPTAGTQGWGLATDGDAIFNNIVLRGGIIGNDALTNPVAPQTVKVSASNFALSTTDTVICSSTVFVPPGFTSAAVFAQADIAALNTRAAADVVLLHARADIFATAPSFAEAAASNYASCSGSLAQVVTGLGTSFVVSASASAQGAAWAVNASNTVLLNAMIMFLR